MDVITLSRLQFAITTIYHFLFVPISLGLSIFIAIMQTMYLKTDNIVYKRLAKFIGKLFIISFAMGVVTGIVQEFHFGMNWSEYSRFMGDIFGAPLALEALTAFFLESVFLGVWIFGEGRLSKKLHCLSIWLVAFGSNLSAFWILVANSFMQNPVGYAVQNGRAEMTDFLALVTNPYVVGQYAHTVLSGITTAGIIVVAVGAYKLLRGENVETFRTGIKAGIVYGLVGLFLVMGSGHMQAQYIGKNVPMKMASMEALWETVDPAPFTVVANIDTENKVNHDAIEIPYLLSGMIYNAPSGEVKGINEMQAQLVQQYGYDDYIPNVVLLFWSFRIMIACGVAMVGALLLAGFLLYTKRLENCRWFLNILVLILPLPFIANTFGWIITEAGRQPWMVVGLQKVSDAVSQNITTTEVMITLVGFTLIYALLAIAALTIAVKSVRKDAHKLDEGGEA
ncbi:MAG TPA: cytochrome ubiquinol oxidase subunit I [Megamonas hypermegale]|uniref:Cytochrome ubiquinol oxidase subunit I n=1 Tax=Megamonas hypermegale TaxID=158847 RepID=A0A921L6Z6_9FIRM|nr:cytochrome ubiquinol oxidase subunit I [Megamonas hypermegale]HJF84148.1 cytochrome ubiquinol oxidase subunit I [Megamonas hypermegale]